MKHYIVDENMGMIAEVNGEIEADIEITYLEEKDKMEGLYKPDFYKYVVTEKTYSYGEKVEA